MEKLVTDLAVMHGKFWMDDRLKEIPWLIDCVLKASSSESK